MRCDVELPKFVIANCPKDSFGGYLYLCWNENINFEKNSHLMETNM